MFYDDYKNIRTPLLLIYDDDCHKRVNIAICPIYKCQNSTSIWVHPRKRQQTMMKKTSQEADDDYIIWDMIQRLAWIPNVTLAVRRMVITQCYYFMMVMMNKDEKCTRRTVRSPVTSMIMWRRCLPTGAEYLAIRYSICNTIAQTEERKLVWGITLSERKSVRGITLSEISILPMNKMKNTVRSTKEGYEVMGYHQDD